MQLTLDICPERSEPQPECEIQIGGLALQPMRPYQESAIAGIIEQHKDNRSTLLVMPTGTGKTRVFTEATVRWPYVDAQSKRVLILAHRDELLQQARKRLGAETGELVGLEQADYYAGEERIVVGSIQTISQPKRLERWPKDHFGLVIVDECFPAGTLIDGVPIEQVRVGDYVWSVDHYSGCMVRRRVVRIFAKPAGRRLVKLCYGATEVTATSNHPFFVKGKGYVESAQIVPGDMLCVWGAVREDLVGYEESSEVVFEPAVQKQAIIDNNGKNQPRPRQSKDDREEPYVKPKEPGKNEAHANEDWPQAKNSGWKWEWSEFSRDGNSNCAAVAHAGGGADKDGPWVRISELLQDRRGQPIPQNSGGGGRIVPWFIVPADAGRKERPLLAWVRVDSCSRVEQASTGRNLVYNLEVEGSHTYFANNALVHNCHHGPSPTYRRVMNHFDGAKILGVTATPDRADEKAMGLCFESVAFVYEIEEAINDGWLVPIRVRQVFVKEIDLSACRTTAGDLNQGDLDAAMAVEEALHGVVDATLRESGDRRTLVYTTSVENARRLAEIFNRYRSGCARDVNGDTPIDVRRYTLSEFERGGFQYLCNCGIATEGYDNPPVSCIAQARPTKSRSLHAQIVGRGLRPYAGKEDCLVLEFTGNSGKHRLACSCDILGGRYEDEEVDAAKELVKKNPGMRADEALAQAHAEAEKRKLAEIARRAKIQARVSYQVREFNPFEILHIKDKQNDWSERFGGSIPTDKQLDALKRWKVPIPKDCTKQQASHLIGTLIKRSNLDLATYAQVQCLTRAGLPAINLSFKKASDLIGYLRAHNWQKPPQDVYDHIVGRERQAGE